MGGGGEVVACFSQNMCPLLEPYIRTKYPKEKNAGFWQCCGSVTFWYGYRSADACL
jgi:hypothetical protein